MLFEFSLKLVEKFSTGRYLPSTFAILSKLQTLPQSAQALLNITVERPQLISYFHTLPASDTG